MKLYLQGAMKWLPFFIASFFFISCSGNPQAGRQLPGTNIDSVKPLLDTAIAPSFDRVADSIKTARLRDSFYAAPVLKTFIDSGDNLAEEKMVSLFIDSSAIRSTPTNFITKSDRRYDKQQMPVRETLTYTSKQYSIKVVNDKPDDFGIKKIYINGKRLQPGKNIDTSLVSDYFLEWIEFDPELFRVLTYKNRDLLYMRGHMEKCNGSGCGVSFHLLYDPALHKAVAIEHYRVTDFYIGAITGSADYSFLCFSPMEYNQLLNNVPYSAKLYRFMANGKLSVVKNKKGEACYFDGYTPNGENDIIIHKAVFP